MRKKRTTADDWVRELSAQITDEQIDAFIAESLAEANEAIKRLTAYVDCLSSADSLKQAKLDRWHIMSALRSFRYQHTIPAVSFGASTKSKIDPDKV